MRLAELIGAFAVAADAGMAMPMDHGLRSAAVAARLAERLGASSREQSEAYYLALLRYVGCTADSDLAAEVMGDENRIRGQLYGVDWASPTEFLPRLARAFGADRSLRGGSHFVAALARMPKMLGTARSHCEVGDRLAARLGFGEAFRAALFQTFERWDGRGWPAKVGGEAIARSMRIAQVAEEIEIGHRAAGEDGARATITKRCGRSLDPELVARASDRLGEVCAPLSGSAWTEALAAEPAPVREADDEQVDEVLRSMGDFADLKSRYTRGHSRGVAALARAAGEALGLAGPDLRTLERAGFVHDVGRVAVTAAIWDKPGPLLDPEWEQVRMHTYVAERIFARCSELAPVAELAASAHERHDGSGYHRRLPASATAVTIRILAAADAYRALSEDRPHRPARAPADAAAEILRMTEDGKLCPEAARAVLAAAGHAVPARSPRTDGLTERELEVLRLVARGLTNKEVASRLGISTKTAGRHLENVYAKLGVTTRAAAGLYAMQHGVLA